MSVEIVMIKYHRTYRDGKEDVFWSGREVGQIIKEDAFHGIIDKVLEIRVVTKSEEKKND